MKKFLYFLIISIAFGGIFLASCERGKKLAPEDEVRNYGKYFVEKLNANRLDSLKVSYPDIAKADSLVPVQSDTILVVETAPGQYDITLAEGITLKVNRTEDGNITVTESKGLFAFPAEKVDIAKKTGMWNDKLSDAQALDRLHDEEFFEYVQNQIKKKTSNILSVIEAGTGFYEDSYVYIQNNTDQPIYGSDYTIQRVTLDFDLTHDIRCYQKHFSEKGRTIAPNRKIKVMCNMAPDGFGEGYVEGVKMNLSPEQLQEKFAPYTGKEYQEYLDSKSPHPLRQDSMRQKMEWENFNNSLPDVKKLYDYDDNQRAQYLKSLGYEKSGGSYSKFVGPRSIIIKFSRGYDSDGRDETNIEITINGDNDALNNLYRKAKPLENLSGGDLGVGVWKDMNKLIISASW